MRQLTTAALLVALSLVVCSPRRPRPPSRPLPSTPLAAAARLDEQPPSGLKRRPLPLRAWCVVEAPDLADGVVCLTRTDLLWNELAALPYGGWDQWEGTVYVARKGRGCPAGEPPPWGGPHHLEAGVLHFWGDPKFLKEIAAALR